MCQKCSLKPILKMSKNCCTDEIDLLNANLEHLLAEEKQLKKKYQQILIENLQKDIIIENLKKKIQSKTFKNFTAELSTDCIKKLKEIGNSKAEDSIFVKSIINDFYDQETLKNKTVSGRSKTSEKTPISPEKKKILETIFEERLKNVEEEERTTRIKGLSKLIRGALDSAGRKK